MPECAIVVSKIARAEWPPDDFAEEGGLVTLSTIFAPAATISLIRGDGDLALASNPCRDAELLDRMAACELCREPGWRAHLFVVGRIERAGRRPAGLLLDSGGPGPTSEIGPRRGMAISWEAVEEFEASHGAQNARRLYFRLVAHEIGHLFRLGHEPAASLMTPLAWFRRRRGYPGNVSLALSAAHRSWLANAPADLIRPGGRTSRGETAAAAAPSEIASNVPSAASMGPSRAGGDRE